MRRKGTNSKGSSGGAYEFQLGDLVLAKVIGFPVWPAKVSRPEDWERAPDNKKYFVEFFGTQEIAFVAPADIQSFTRESKRKLLATCRGKTVKYFLQAVKEIFDELPKHDNQGHNDLCSKVRKTNGSYCESIKGLKTKKSRQSNSEVVSASVLGESSAPAPTDKRTASAKNSVGKLHEMKNMGKGSDSHSSGDIATSFTVPFHFSPVKVEKMSTENGKLVTHQECIDISRATSASSYSRESDVERGSSYHDTGTKAINILDGVSVPLEPIIREYERTANIDKSKFLISPAKRKAENTTFQANDSKVARRDVGLINTLGRLSLLKGSKLFDIVKNGSQNLSSDSEGRCDDEFLRQKNGQAVHEQLQSGKKAKSIETMADDAMGFVFKNGRSNLESGVISEEAVPSVEKHCSQGVEAMSNDDRRNLGIGILKSNLPKKRRAIRLCDDGDDEPKTPVHGGSAKSVVKVVFSYVIPDSAKQNNEKINEFANSSGQNMKGFGQASGSLQDHHPSVKSAGELLTAFPSQKLDDSVKVNVSHDPGLEAKGKRLGKEREADLISPEKSPQAVVRLEKSADEKSSGPSNMVTKPVTPSEFQNISAKGSILASYGSNSSQNNVSSLRSTQSTSVDRSKVLKTGMRSFEPATSLDKQRDHDSSSVVRLEDAKYQSGSLLNSKTTHTAFSMKNLIAAAQAKRRQAHIQNAASGMEDSVLAPSVKLLGRSPSTSSPGRVFQSVVGTVTQHEVEEPLTSPAGHTQQQLELEELEEKGQSLGLQSAGSTLSRGTEAAVARDAFEGMIETLSRTKESIGRATRLAISCAKYGIASEVVDLLIRKLENESSFRRRVDLFFLVDSISQCSHSQKGIAGASYLPTVQAALPRLLGAAAPSGPNARENRRQCLKVLRLWLERKILPESVLRRCMDDIRSSNDDTISGQSFKRPSRAERSVDDPIREMEGMLVDEYGSNATLNFPGFVSHGEFIDVEEDEENIPTMPPNLSEASPLQCMNASTEPDVEIVSPSDKHHHILEDVDVELEMEDVSGHPKDGMLSSFGLLENDEQAMQLDGDFNPPASNMTEPPSLEGSPSLPLESPPPLPPLPSSPLPSLPSQPPLPLSPPLPPPPPSTLPLEPTPPILLPPGAPNHGYQLAFPEQPSGMSHAVFRPPAVLPSAQMARNTSQLVSCFVPSGPSSSHQCDSGQGDVYLASQFGPSSQQFQPSETSFAQRMFQPVTQPQHPPGHFMFNKPSIVQHMAHPSAPPPPPPPHPYSAANSEGLKQFGDEQWRSTRAEYKVDNNHCAWVNGGWTQSYPTPTFIGEGFVMP